MFSLCTVQRTASLSSSSTAPENERCNAFYWRKTSQVLRFRIGSRNKITLARTYMLRGIELAFVLPFAASWVRHELQRVGPQETHWEERMPCYEPRWERCPTAACCERVRRWLTMQANRMLARNTIESYSRSMEDFLIFVGKRGVSPEAATREHVAEYLRDLLTRENPARPKMLYIDSGAGLSNATVNLRLTVVLRLPDRRRDSKK